MSLQALLWVTHDIPKDLRSSSIWVLLALADEADDEGRGAMPGIKRLMKATSASRATVYRAIDDLKERGLIREGDARRAFGYPKQHRPKVWDLALDKKWGVTDETSPTTGGLTVETPQPEGVSLGVSCGVSPEVSSVETKPGNPETHKPLYIVSQSSYVSNSKTDPTDRPTKIPNIKPKLQKACEALAIDIDDEWARLKERVETGEQPKDWSKVFAAWLERAIDYAKRHPSERKVRKDPRTEAEWCRLETTLDQANDHDIHPRERARLRRVFFSGFMAAQEASEKVLAEASTMGLILPDRKK